MPADLTQFGTLGRYLLAEQWEVVPRWNLRGTAAANAYLREVWMRPPALKVAHRPGRIRDYVLRHELAHAAHAGLLGYDVAELVAARGLKRLAAIEVVADAWCLSEVKSQQMYRWVQNSVIWHGRVGSKYSMRDVQSPEAGAAVERLRDALATWEAGRG